MKNKLIAVAALVGVASCSCTVQASEMTTLQQQTKKLKKQNQDLAKRLDRIEKHQNQVPTAEKRNFVADAGSVIKGPLAVLTDDGPITWHGVTLFGSVDAGLQYATHGLPQGALWENGNSFIGKNANHAQSGVIGSGMGQSTLGIKGEQELLPGVAGVFYAATGINPNSGRLYDGPSSQVQNNGLNRLQYSTNGDSSRAGQAFNDQLYAGFSSSTFGQLTFGRHRSFASDVATAYDPQAGSYAFSLLGYSSTPVAGLGDTEETRWDDSLKYKLTSGPVRFGAMYKFADGASGSNLSTSAPVYYASKNYAYQFDLGGSFAALDIDVAGGYANQAISTGILSAAQLAGASKFTSNVGLSNTATGNNANTLAGTISDNTGVAVGAKYTWNQFKFFAGYAYVSMVNPHNNVGVGADANGGYALSTVANNAFPHAKTLQTEWTGVRYAYDSKTDIALAIYHEVQNTYGTGYTVASNCSLSVQSGRPGTCSGTLSAASVSVDYHFTKRFDVYGGLTFSNVAGGLSSGYLYSTDWSPTVGARYTF